ncbi:MAG TPA: hypothetical protein VGK89_11950 [Candidatus Eisenbacteria bacterium]
MMRFRLAVVVLLLALAPAAEAKKFRYASGPKPAVDTVLSVADVEVTPLVRARGPKVAATNLQLATLVANVAIERAMKSMPLDSGTHVLLAPAESHPLNFVVEHAVLRQLARRGISATIRRSILPDDSLLAVAGNPGDPVLEYQLASARVTYLRLVGGYILPSRTKVERQALVEGTLSLRDPAGSRVLWTGDASHNLVDVIPRGQLPLVEDERYSDLKGTVPERNLGKFTEPIVVVAVVSGLIALFFQNRP